MVESEANTNAEEEALNRLRTTDPVQYLSPSPELSRLARAASSFLYLSLLPFCPTKPPLDQLLADEQFDAEQIWGQIDLLSKPLIPFLKRQINRLEKEPKPQSLVSPPLNITAKEDESEEENNGESGEGESDEDDLEEDEGEEIEEDEEEEEEERKGVEDKFLRIKELEKFLEQGEAEEYGDLQSEKNGKDGSDVEEEDNDDDEEEGFTFGGDMNDEDDEGEEANQAEYARYEDFFGGNANKGTRERNSSKKKVHFEDELEDLELENQEDQEDEDTDDANENDKKNLSTHEKEMQKLKSKIDQMEKANLEPKTWTMQGEVSAAKRPKNSALEVDLDFEHNTRPVPVITEEVTASIEEIIKKRIIDSKFDDVERAPALPVKAPRELKEMDETKSKKGLAELYEEDYTQKAGLAPAPLSSSDEIKKEADVLFKKICLKLDALSHFHFAPKPVIEDMSIQVNVPALAMEEIAPVAVSDAAMLAPEEIFEGKGDIKEDKELTQSERKRRRANKKRKFKARADKRAPKKPRNEAVETNGIIA